MYKLGRLTLIATLCWPYFFFTYFSQYEKLRFFRCVYFIIALTLCITDKVFVTVTVDIENLC